MAGELAIDKMRIRLNVPVELVHKVLKTFKASIDESNNTSFVRALEEGCRGCILTKKDYAEIGEIIDKNRKKRLKKRQREKQERIAEGRRAAASVI